jgi:hypothetical protein
MANLTALMTSNNIHYCSPPDILEPMRRVLVPRGCGRRLLDPGSNDASQVGAHLVLDGEDGRDGLSFRWSEANCFYNNPEYGTNIKKWTAKQAYWGRSVGVPGIALLPARDDTEWCQRHIFGTADAWVHVGGRLTFWLPIPLDRSDAGPPKDGESERYYLRRWFPLATDDDLPPPFVSVGPGLAVGPELGKNGKPQPAPFPSLVAFWADPISHEHDPRAELEALRELVRVAVASMGKEDGKDGWLADAEAVLGAKRFRARGPLDPKVFEKLISVGKAPDHAISVRAFAREFGSLGNLTIARGVHRGVYQNMRRVDA